VAKKEKGTVSGGSELVSAYVVLQKWGQKPFNSWVILKTRFLSFVRNCFTTTYTCYLAAFGKYLFSALARACVP
jgi:hypothetical protein